MTGPVDHRRALGLEIKRVIDRSPMLKKQVARNLGVSPALLSNWFAGRAVPSPEQLAALERFATDNGDLRSESLRDVWQRAKRAAESNDFDSGESSEFLAFIGDDADAFGMALVYPEFVVRSGTLSPKNGIELHPDLAKYPSELAGPALSGFGPVVSSRDLSAASTVNDLLQHHGVRGRFAVDAIVAQQGAQHPLIAFGLESNAITTFYLRSSAHRPLFEIRRGDVQSIVLPDGREFWSEPPIWRGVVARITPRPDDQPSRKWIFCAGIGAIGTSAAAGYLSLYWRDLHRAAGASDFVAVVSGHELTPSASTRDALYIAEGADDLAAL